MSIDIAYEKDGVIYCEGDRVKAFKRTALPEQDGWGREVRYNPPRPTQYQEQNYEGVVIIKAWGCRAALYLKTDLGWEQFLDHFDKLEKCG